MKIGHLLSNITLPIPIFENINWIIMKNINIIIQNQITLAIPNTAPKIAETLMYDGNILNVSNLTMINSIQHDIQFNLYEQYSKWPSDKLTRILTLY